MQTIAASRLHYDVFPSRIFPLYRHLITDVLLDSEYHVVERCLHYLDLVDNLAYLALSSPFASSSHYDDDPFLHGSPWKLPAYKTNEHAHVTALRNALRRIRHLSIDKFYEAEELGPILRTAAPGLESLTMRWGKKHGRRGVDLEGMREMTDLRHLCLDEHFTIQLFLELELPSAWPAWPLQSLDLSLTESDVNTEYIDLIDSVASTLKKLRLTCDEPLDRVQPLFTRPLPLLVDLTLVNTLSAFAECSSQTPNLCRLRIDLGVDEDHAPEFLTKSLPSLFSSLPFLTNFHLDFSPFAYTDLTDPLLVKLDPAATKLLVETCKSRAILFRTSRRFKPFGPSRAKLWWFGVDGSLTLNTANMFVKEKGEVLAKKFESFAKVVARAQAGQDADMIDRCLGAFDKLV